MSALKVTSRVSRNVRVNSIFRQRRLESTVSSVASSSNHTASVIAGLAGGGLVFLGGYGWYHFSGAKTFVNTAHQAQETFKSYTKQLKSASPDFEPNQAIEWLRSTAKSYGAMIPGASGYIDSTFDDIDAIRQKHGKEVDAIVKEAYDELEGVSHEGMSVGTATKAWNILQKHLQRIGDLAGDAAQDIVNNHPALKDKVGGNLDQLKQMGDKYGPEAKKQLDETWDQIKEVMKGGVSASTIPKVQQLVQEKIQKMQELGGKVWDQSMEKAKPLLDKSPEVKEMVEQNADKLKQQGNVHDFYEKIKDAVSSGNTNALKEYVQKTVQKTKQGGSGGSGGSGGLEKYLDMVPGGADIIPKLTEIQKIAEQHGEEAQSIVKDTFKEIEQVLRKKLSEAEELAQKAGKKAKDS